MVNKVLFVGFRGAVAPIDPLDPPLRRLNKSQTRCEGISARVLLNTCNSRYSLSNPGFLFT